jgi:hypothetical protein
MKTSKNKAERLSLQDSNEVVRFLSKLGVGEPTYTLNLTRGHIRAVTFDAQPDENVDLDATRPVSGRDFHNVITSRIQQGLIFRAKTGRVFRVFQSNSSIPPMSM